MMDVKARKRISSSSSTSSTTQSDQDEIMAGDLRRGPWTVEEDFKLMNYIASHGEGRWNSLARCAGLKRTGKSCRLRWLNYLRPDVRRGNITLEEQLMILELHSRWGNRWSKIAQHLPGRTDNEIKNYWRTRVQKHAKQLKCDVNSKQFKDTMRYLWMPRLIERIQAAATATTTTSATTTVGAPMAAPLNYNAVMAPSTTIGVNMAQNDRFGTLQSTLAYTPENSSTAASSDSFGTQVSPVSDLTTDYYTNPMNYSQNPDYFQSNPVGNYNESLISPSGYYGQGIDFQGIEQNNSWSMDGMDTSDNLWNVDDVWLLQQLSNNNM